MASPTGLWSTYDLGYSAGSGIYESVNDALQQIDPTDTPGIAQFGETTIRAVTHDWVVTKLNATSTAGVAEGRDFVGTDRAPRWRYTNTCQIYTNDIIVSDTVQAVSTIGVENEYLFALSQEMINQRRNIEASIWKIDGASATGDEATPTARTMKGLRGFTGTGVPSAPANAPSINIINGAAGLTTAAVVSAHQTAYSRGVKADSLWFSPGVKTTWVNAAIASGNNLRFNLPADDNMLVADVEIFRSPFGLLRVNTDVFIPESSASSASAAWFLLEKSKVRLAWLRKMKQVEIAKIGDSIRGQVTSELTLELLHPYAVSVVTGITA